MKNNYCINIGRQLGSGGRQIGQLLSEQLNIPFYDKELIALASKQSGLKQEVFEKADEKKRFTLTGGFLGLKEPTLDGSFSQSYLWNEMLFKIQSDVIKNLARDKSCIFVGRCADYILRDMSNTLNVFISAEFNDRVERVKKRIRNEPVTTTTIAIKSGARLNRTISASIRPYWALRQQPISSRTFYFKRSVKNRSI